MEAKIPKNNKKRKFEGLNEEEETEGEAQKGEKSAKRIKTDSKGLQEEEKGSNN